jgi:predicted esterase
MAGFVTSAGGIGSAGRTFGPIVTLPAPLKHTATVVILHGLGDTGNGWAPVAQQLALPHVKWVFPTAPTRPITVNMGMSMPGWFNITEFSFSDHVGRAGDGGFDPEGIKESVGWLAELVDSEARAGIPHSRMVVGGFSQGGHVALKYCLRAEKKLAGCAALSTWMEPLGGKIPEHNTSLPIFFGHGSADPLIPPVIANATVAALESAGCRDVVFKMYPGMAHASCPQELTDLKQFLSRVLPDDTGDEKVTAEDLKGMTGGQLKRFLQLRGVKTAGLLEKRDLLEVALALVNPS